MPIPVTTKPVAPRTTAPTPSTDLSALLGKTSSLATKDDLAAVLKSGIAPGALADAILGKLPGTESVKGEFVSALLDTLKADPSAKKSEVATERLSGLGALAQTLQPAAATSPAPITDGLATQKADAAPTPHEQTQTQHGHKQLAKTAGKKNLGFETVDKAAETAAPAKVDLGTAVQTARAQLEQADVALQSLPEGLKKQTANALNNYGRVPDAAAGAVQQLQSTLGGIEQSVNAMAPDDQKAFFAQFGIDSDFAAAAAKSGDAGAKKPNVALAQPQKPNPLNPRLNPAIGSRVSPLEQSPALQLPGSPLNQQIPIDTSGQPDSRTEPPMQQLRDVLVSRLSFAGIQPTQMDPINWDNPQALPTGQALGPNGVPQYGAPASSAASQPLPGKLGALLESFGPTLSADQMKQFLQAAKSEGTSADTIADQLGSGQGPFAQLGPRLGEGATVLVDALDRKDVAAFNRRANGIVNVGSHELAAMNPSNAGNPGNLISGDDMGALLQQGGATPMTLAQQILSGKGPLTGRVTQEAVGTLMGSIDPSSFKTKTEATAAANVVQGLKGMMASLPVAAAAVMQGGQNAFMGSYLNPFMQNPRGTQFTGAQATAAMGFMPTGNTTFDLANAVANAPTYSPTEQALLASIKDPQQQALQALQMMMQKQALLATTLSNLANMRYEMLKTVANNLRA